ncbi:MAG: DUF3429 domain-containing protein [Pseudomonadota bacterium]
MLRPGAFSIPFAPLSLTLAGLIPFVGSAIAVATAGNDVILKGQASFILLVYGAVILSFLGGVRWGIEMSRNEAPRFGVLVPSVAGALVGWAVVCLNLLNPGQSTQTLYLALAGALILHWLWDLASRASTPNWYDGLRTIATLGAVGSFLVATVVV